MASFSLHGIAVSQGIAIGRAHLMAPAALDVKHYLIAADQVEAEIARIRTQVAFVERDRYLAPDLEAMRLWALRAELPAALLDFLPSHA